jgi:hypothetical protein
MHFLVYRLALSGKFILKLDFDNEITIKVFALNFQGSQYKKMFDKDFGKFCEAVYDEQLKTYYNKVQNHFDVKVPCGI